MEKEYTQMHEMVNELYDMQQQMTGILEHLSNQESFKPLVTEGKTLVQKMKTWDEEMIQRKSKAYDDVENFPNKFTANYLFLINQTESDIPQVNQPSLDRLKELDVIWKGLQQRGMTLKNQEIPAFNKRLWDAGIGAIWSKKENRP